MSGRASRNTPPLGSIFPAQPASSAHPTSSQKLRPAPPSKASKMSTVLFNPQATAWHQRQAMWRPLAKQATQKATDLTSMPPPSNMDADQLGQWANVAAREGVHNEVFWNIMTTRAKQLTSSMESTEIALFLNAIARVRRTDKELFQMLAPVIRKKMIYFSSIYLAMVLAAYAKAGVYDVSLMSAYVREIQARLQEFQTPVELSMLINALAKLHVYDKDLFDRLAAQVLFRMKEESFHIRELSVIAGAFARVNHLHPALFDAIAERARITIAEAYPLELARMIHAYAKVGRNAPDLFEVCIHYAAEKLLFMSPSELATTAFAFGQIREVISEEQLPILQLIFDKVRQSSVTSIALFHPKDISSFLMTYARWRLPFEHGELITVIDRVFALKGRFQQCVPDLVSVLWSISLLVRHTWEEGDSSSGASVVRACQYLLVSNLDVLTAAMAKNQLNMTAIVRIVDSFAAVRSCNRELLDAVHGSFVRRYEELDPFAASLLFDNFTLLGYNPEEDFMLLLSDKMAEGKDREPGTRPAALDPTYGQDEEEDNGRTNDDREDDEPGQDDTSGNNDAASTAAAAPPSPSPQPPQPAQLNGQMLRTAGERGLREPEDGTVGSARVGRVTVHSNG